MPRSASSASAEGEEVGIEFVAVVKHATVVAVTRNPSILLQAGERQPEILGGLASSQPRRHETGPESSNGNFARAERDLFDGLGRERDLDRVPRRPDVAKVSGLQ